MTRRVVASPVGWRLLLAFGFWLAALPLAVAAPEAGAWQSVVSNLDAELPSLLAALDDNQYEVRQAAQYRLDDLVADAACRSKLAVTVERRLAQPGLSLEARETLERLLARLPKPAVAAPPPPSAAELDRLIAALDDNSYPARIAAAEKLADLLADRSLATRIGNQLKQHLADPAVGLGARKSMDLLWKQARGVWLLSDNPAESAKPVSDLQLQAWFDDLTLPLPATERRSHEVRVRVENARRELLDLLVCDAELPRVKAALEKRLAGADDEVVINRFRELFDWTRPAMVAEYWQTGRHTGVQHLLIGIPNHSPNAQRASHFDRIDEHTAHCVSGNALSPGDYPVDVFFPHPRQEDAQFHLVNLPTPRRRMAYEYSIATGEAERHAMLSEKTLASLLAARRLVTAAEMNMLRFLDHPAVSRFAGRYLLTVADQPAPPELGFGSYHGLLCAVLAEGGTREAIPGLLRAIEREKILSPNADQPYRLPIVAALSIARRDPWPEVEAWLEPLLKSDERLSIVESHEAQLSATASAVLLEQHSVSPVAFGLERVEDETLTAAGCPAYRFATPEDRTAVVRWWAKQKEQLATRPRRSS